jgi:hypothetical protein
VDLLTEIILPHVRHVRRKSGRPCTVLLGAISKLRDPHEQTDVGSNFFLFISFHIGAKSAPI